jgi:uncharacterized protein
MSIRTMLGGAAVTAAAALLMAAGGAHAQAEGAVDAERLALAEKIYAMMGDQTMRSITGALKGALSASLKAEAGQDTARAQAVQAALSDSLDDMMPRVVQGTARIMARDFSAQELRDMLAFYQSPTGQAVLRRMPEVTQQSMQMSLSLLPGFMQKFESDYCARITCSPQEKQAFDQLNARMSQSRAAPAAP